MPTSSRTATIKTPPLAWRLAMRWLLMIAIVSFLPLAQGAANAPVAAPVRVQTLTNLERDASEAQRQRIPILIAFFASWCKWCERVEQEFLRPMLLSGEYQDKVIIRKLEIDSDGRFIGLNGRPVQAAQFADQYRVDLTPTLVFIDHRGNELAERMIGLTTPEMYGGYLDNAIDDALSHYREQPSDE